MEKLFVLDRLDFSKLEFKIRYICDRLDMLPELLPRLPKTCLRNDVYWINIYFENEMISLLYLYNSGSVINIHTNYSYLKPDQEKQVQNLALTWFKKQPEYQNYLALIEQRNSYTGNIFVLFDNDGIAILATTSKESCISDFRVNRKFYSRYKEMSQDEYLKLFSQDVLNVIKNSIAKNSKQD